MNASLENKTSAAGVAGSRALLRRPRHLLPSRAIYPLAKRVLDAALAGTLLVLCVPVALVALAPLRQRALPAMAATVCAGRAGR
jgi:hypothetical protein